MVFFPKITLPTRIGERSSSLIDNIFTNDTEEKETAGILLNHLSDHQIIFTYIEKLSYIEKLLHTPAKNILAINQMSYLDLLQ